jgi:hypothetical protein
MIAKPLKKLVITKSKKARTVPLVRKQLLAPKYESLDSLFRRFRDAVKKEDYDLQGKILYTDIVAKIKLFDKELDNDQFRGLEIYKKIISFLSSFKNQIPQLVWVIKELESDVKKYKTRENYLFKLKKYDGSLKAQEELWDIVLKDFSEKIVGRSTILYNNKRYIDVANLHLAFQEISQYYNACPRTIRAAVYFKFIQTCLENKDYPRSQGEEAYGHLLANVPQLLSVKYTPEENKFLNDIIIRKLPAQIKIDISEILHALTNPTGKPS